MVRIRGFVLGHCNTRNKHLLTIPQLCTYVTIKLYYFSQTIIITTWLVDTCPRLQQWDSLPLFYRDCGIGFQNWQAVLQVTLLGIHCQIPYIQYIQYLTCPSFQGTLLFSSSSSLFIFILVQVITGFSLLNLVPSMHLEDSFIFYILHKFFLSHVTYFVTYFYSLIKPFIISA